MFRCDNARVPPYLTRSTRGKRLCQAHFDEDVSARSGKTLRQTGLFGRGARVARNLNGGIGSAVLAFVSRIPSGTGETSILCDSYR